MKVYLHSDRAERSASYIVNIAPGGDTLHLKPADCPKDWFLPNGDAKQFQVDFKFGMAEVDSEIGRYMLSRDIAKSNRMLRRVKQLFDRHGLPIEEVFDADGKRILFDTEAAAA
jgi:hypothetical protein